MRWKLVCLAVTFVVACGTSPGATDAGTDAAYGHKSFDASTIEAGPSWMDCDAGATPSTSYPAPHPKMPQVATSGGPVMPSPRFVPIVFAGDDRTSDVAGLAKAIAASSYWTSIVTQYGVGAATASDPIIVQETPPVDLQQSDPATWLASKLDGTHADFGAPDPSAIYVVYYPATTTIHTTWGDTCQLLYGYHGESVVGTTRIVFAAIARCNPQMVTTTTSHELFEAATDPYLETNPAYTTVDDPQNAALGEIGDLCEGKIVTPDDVGYPVQRIWSNAASAAGHDPCQPSSGPYFRTVSSVPSLGVPAGESRTINLVAFSDADTGGPWKVDVAVKYKPQMGDVGLALCRSHAENGETIPLTITRDASSTNANVVVITSSLGDASTTWQFDIGLF